MTGFRGQEFEHRGHAVRTRRKTAAKRDPATGRFLPKGSGPPAHAMDVYAGTGAEKSGGQPEAAAQPPAVIGDPAPDPARDALFGRAEPVPEPVAEVPGGRVVVVHERSAPVPQPKPRPEPPTEGDGALAELLAPVRVDRERELAERRRLIAEHDRRQAEALFARGGKQHVPPPRFKTVADGGVVPW